MEELSFKELIKIIRMCQKELDKRGTLTKCEIIYFTGTEKTVFLEIPNL